MTSENIELAHIKQVRRDAQLIHDQATVDRAYDQLAADIQSRLADRVPVVVCVLIGGIVPTANLLDRFKMECELSYVHATRYKRSTKGSDLHWIAPVFGSLVDRDVLIVDDILDEGDTLAALETEFLASGARSVLKAVLTKKLRSQPSSTEADFVGLEVPDRYVFGSGMDYKGYLRDMHGIWALNT